MGIDYVLTHLCSKQAVSILQWNTRLLLLARNMHVIVKKKTFKHLQLLSRYVNSSIPSERNYLYLSYHLFIQKTERRLIVNVKVISWAINILSLLHFS